MDWSWFGLSDSEGKQDKKVLKELADIYKIDENHADKFEEKLKSLSKTNRQLAIDIRNSGETTGNMSTAFLTASKSLNKMSISSRLAAAGMKALATATNFGVMLLISETINLTIKGLDALIITQQEAIDKSNELTSAWKSQKESISGNKKSIEDCRDEFKKLAVGVDESGKNIALSAEQFNQYNELANKIAEISPELVKGYTAERNAILDKNTAIDDTITKLERELELEDIKLLNGKKEMYKASAGNIKDLESDKKKANENIYFSDLDISDAEKEIERLQQLRSDVSSGKYDKEQGFERDKASIDTHLANIDYMINEEEIRYNNSHANRTQYLSQITMYEQQIDDENTKYFNTIGRATLNQNEAYTKLSDTSKILVNSLSATLNVGNISSDEYTNEIYKTVEAVNNLSVKQIEAMNKLFDPKLKTLNVKEYQSQIELLLSSLPEDLQAKIKLAIDFDIDDNNKMLSEISSKLKISENDLGQLSIEDLKFAYINLGDIASNSISELIVKLTELKNANQTPITIPYDDNTLKKLNEDLDKIQSAYHSVSEAVKEYSEKGYLSLDATQALLSLGDEYLKYLVDENGKLTLSKQGYVAMANAKLDDLLASKLQETLDTVSRLEEEALATDTSTTSIEDHTEALKKDNVEVFKSLQSKVLSGEITNQSIVEAMKSFEQYESIINKTRSGLGKGGLNTSSDKSDRGDKWKEAFDAKKAELQWRSEAELLTEEQYLNQMAALTDQYFMNKSKYEKEWYQNKKEIKKGWTALQKAEFDKQYNYLQYQRDKGAIVEKQYLDKLEALNTEYHNKSTEDWRKYELEIINGKQKLWEAEQKAQGDAYVKSIDKRIKALNDEKKTEQDSFDAKIEALNEQKKALQDQYTEEDKLLDLELKKQAIEKANSQKTALIYRDGRFVYEADSEVVDNAKQDLSDAQREFDRYQIEKNIDDQIKSYEDAKQASIDSIDGQIEEWENLKTSVQEQMDQIGETVDEHNEQIRLMAELESMSFDEMTSAVSNYVDTFITKMNELKSYQDALREQAKSDNEASKKPAPVKAYARGRFGGIKEDAIVDELGRRELIARTFGGRITSLEYGDSVIPADLSRDFFKTISSYTPDINSVFNLAPKMSIPNIKPAGAGAIHISFGDLSLPNVTDSDSFAKTINNKIMNTVTQEVFKRN